MGPGEGTRHWRLRSKRPLDCEQGRESEREVRLEDKSRSAASAPTKLRVTVYWLAVLWAMLRLAGAPPSGCWARRLAWFRQGERSDRAWTPDRGLTPDRVAHRAAVGNRPLGGAELREMRPGECLRRRMLRLGAVRREAMRIEPFGPANEPGHHSFYAFRIRRRYPTQCSRWFR